jgi:DNA-binding NarL/FixJ family response regulator/two-component sensor histidine kinase
VGTALKLTVATSLVERLRSEARKAALEERERIGRDLHDDLGQVLGYVSVQSQAALAQLSRDEIEKTRSTLKQLVQVAQNAHTDVRRYILGIRTGKQQSKAAFIPALEEYLETLETIYDLKTKLSLPPEWERSPVTSEVETQLLRIIQEALTNIRKHADTRRARLIFTDHDDEVQVIISDDGAGFDLPNMGEGEMSGHFGLSIMRERAERVGGDLTIRSASGEGTQIIVRMPKVIKPDPEENLKGLRILLVDDHQLYLEGIQNLLRTRGMRVVGLAENGLQAQELAAEFHPDLILMDVDMPVCNGLEATRQIKIMFPEIKIVMLTVAADEEKLMTALRYGASGYLLKDLDGPQFFQMLAEVMRNEPVLSPKMAARMLSDIAQATAGTQLANSKAAKDIVLTPRQQHVLELVTQGYSNKEIAQQLGLTKSTVKHHVGQVLKRYQLKSRYELIHLLQSRDPNNPS